MSDSIQLVFQEILDEHESGEITKDEFIIKCHDFFVQEGYLLKREVEHGN